MSKNKKKDYKHLTLSQRLHIEKGLENNESFSLIAKRLEKDPSTISKEVRRHRTEHVKRDMNHAIPCVNRSQCRVRSLCNDRNCIKLCKICSEPDFYCSKVCPDYQEKQCEKLDKPPYVCNGCPKKNGCLLRKFYYTAKYADDCYRDLLVYSREGINQAPVDIAMLDALISPLLKKVNQWLTFMLTMLPRSLAVERRCITT